MLFYCIWRLKPQLNVLKFVIMYKNPQEIVIVCTGSINLAIGNWLLSSALYGLSVLLGGLTNQLRILRSFIQQQWWRLGSDYLPDLSYSTSVIIILKSKHASISLLMWKFCSASINNSWIGEAYACAPTHMHMYIHIKHSHLLNYTISSNPSMHLYMHAMWYHDIFMGHHCF